MLRSLLVACFAILSGFAIAEDNASLRELNFSPSFGYSSFSGFVGGGKISVSLPLISCLQLETGGMVMGGSSPSTASGMFAGPVINFGNEDIKRRYYFGAGVGFSNTFPYGKVLRDEQKLAYGYAKFGKRFVLNDAGTILYKPEISVSMAGGNRTDAYSIEFLQFSWAF